MDQEPNVADIQYNWDNKAEDQAILYKNVLKTFSQVEKSIIMSLSEALA